MPVILRGMTESSLAYLTPEARARVRIDDMLTAAGWAVQDAKAVSLGAARGVAVREFVLKPPHGRADYLLFVDRHAVGVLEAKKEGETLTGVAWQTAKYLDGLPDEIPTALEGALPFAYQSTGVETRFTNTLDPAHASRDVFSFHRPETLAGWIEDVSRHPSAPTLRHRLQQLSTTHASGRHRRARSRTSRHRSRRTASARSSRWPPAPGRPSPPRASPTA